MNISKEYQEELKKLHDEKKSFGKSSSIPSEVIKCIEKYNVESILDFGCGKGFVTASLREKYPNIKIYGYDPGQDGFDELPKNVDMIFSQDVLEHIEPEELENVLQDLALRCNKVMYHLIACHPAKKTLSDGRNAHLIIESPDWWRQKLSSVLNWKMFNEFTTDKMVDVKKGPAIRVIKYGLTLEK